MRLAVWLIERPRWFKRTLLIANDFALLSLAIWAAYTLRLSRPYVPASAEKWILLIAAPVIGVFVFLLGLLFLLVKETTYVATTSARFTDPNGRTLIVNVH